MFLRSDSVLKIEIKLLSHGYLDSRDESMFTIELPGSYPFNPDKVGAIYIVPARIMHIIDK
jgi:hypothetical protein